MSYLLEKDFQVTTSAIYNASLYQPLGVAIGYLLTAYFVDKVGIKKVLSITMWLMSGLLYFFSVNTAFSHLMYIRLLLGILIGCVYNCCFGALPIIFCKEKLPKATSALYIFAFTAAMLGPVILVHKSVSWRGVMLFMSVLTGVSGILSAVYFPHKRSDITPAQYMRNIKQLLSNRVFLMMIIVSTLCMGGFYGFVTLLINSLRHAGISSAGAKFIIKDVQFVSRAILLTVNIVCSMVLMPHMVTKALRIGLRIMGLSAVGLLLILISGYSPFAQLEPLQYCLARNASVFYPLLTTASGVWLFWLYAAFIGVVQPANKSRALTIAGRDAGGSAQAMIGCSLSVGEYIFAAITSVCWPIGGVCFLLFVIFAALYISSKLSDVCQV